MRPEDRRLKFYELRDMLSPGPETERASRQAGTELFVVFRGGPVGASPGSRRWVARFPDSTLSYGICATVMLNSPTAPGAKALTPGWYWPGAAGIPVSTPLKLATPGRTQRTAQSVWWDSQKRCP